MVIYIYAVWTNDHQSLVYLTVLLKTSMNNTLTLRQDNQKYNISFVSSHTWLFSKAPIGLQIEIKIKTPWYPK